MHILKKNPFVVDGFWIRTHGVDQRMVVWGCKERKGLNFLMSCGALVVAEASGCGGDGVLGAEDKHSKAKESLDFDDAETVHVGDS